MENKKTQNAALAIIGLLLIIIGIYYYKNQAKEPVNTGDNTVSEETGTPVAEDKTGENAKPTSVDQDKEALRTKQFNLAIANAQLAFSKGEYEKSIALYNEALSYKNSDSAYAGLFTVYNAQNNVDKARVSIETAIKLNPLFAEHWMNKLTFLDEKTTVSFTDLKTIYTEGMTKIDGRSKINFATRFAVIAENNKEYTEAIALWEYAKKEYPANSAIYQAEIDRLKLKN